MIQLHFVISVKFFNTKLVKTIAAVKEPKHPTQKKLYIGNPKLKRFNSGVMLFNTKKYVSKDYLKKIIITSKNSKINGVINQQQITFLEMTSNI